MHNDSTIPMNSTRNSVGRRCCHNELYISLEIINYENASSENSFQRKVRGNWNLALYYADTSAMSTSRIKRNKYPFSHEPRSGHVLATFYHKKCVYPFVILIDPALP